MSTTQKKFQQRTAISAALLAAFSTAWADADIKALTKPDSSVSIGVGNWSGDRAQQGIYDGMRNNGTYGLFDADIAKRDDATGRWFKFKALNLGLDNRELRTEYLQQSNFGAFFEYGKTVRANPYTVNTGLQGIGTTNVTVGTNLGTFPRSNVDLKTTREMTRIGGIKNIWPGLDAKIDFKTEDKKGARMWGWGSAALFSAEPIDSNTRQLDAILQYTGKQLQLSGGYSGSWYDNHNAQVTERLHGVAGGTSASFNAVTPLSLPLSNEAHQLFLDGGYGFTSSTRATFKLAYTKATQNEYLPSYDLTGANAPFVNGPSHLEGAVNTTLAQLGLSSKPTSKLSIIASARYYDVQDKTPLAGYVGSNTTGAATGYNTPHSYTTNTSKLEATYRLPESFNVTGGIDTVATNRSYPTVGTVYAPFRVNTTETTYRTQLRRSLGEDLNGTLAYFHSERRGSGYTSADGSAPYSNQINPIHLADRARDKWRTALDWDATDALSLQLRADMSKDAYPANGRAYGLQDGSSQVYAVDATYTFSEDWQFTFWYSRDITEARQTGFRQASGGSADATKIALLRDVGDSVGMSLRGRFSSRLEAGLGLDWFGSTSSYPQDLALTGAGTSYPTGSVGPLPDVRNKLLRIKFDGKYALDKSSDLRFDVIYERWHTDDWSWNFANGSPFAYYSGTQACTGCIGPGYTGVVDGTTVNAKQTQISTFVGLRYIYKFQ